MQELGPKKSDVAMFFAFLGFFSTFVTVKKGSTDKKYYKIGDVAEMLGLPASTLRFWESQFPTVKPRRNAKGTRYYTPDDIEALRMVCFLVKEKGLHIEAAQQELKVNREGVSRKAEAVAALIDVRDRLQNLLDSLHKLR